jgi:hypothetical protein
MVTLVPTPIEPLKNVVAIAGTEQSSGTIAIKLRNFITQPLFKCIRIRGHWI